MNELPAHFWLIASVEQEPQASLMNWRVFEVVLREGAATTFHLVGYALEVREGRVSSAIQAIDLEKMVVKTISGRIYWLRGKAGFDGSAEFVWREWLGRTGANLIGEITHALPERVRQLPRPHGDDNDPNPGS